jgi:hypothetical protein
MKLKRLAVLIAGSFSLACGNEPTGPGEPGVLRIEPTKASFSPGDTIKLTLHNLGEKNIVYNACGLTLERWNGTRWVEFQIGSGEGVLCPAIETFVNARQSRTILATILGARYGVLPAQFPVGIYRALLISAFESGSTEPLPRESAPFHFAGFLPD